MKKEILYVDMDGVLCDFVTDWKKDKASFPDIPYPQARYGFFRNLKPLEGAIEGMAFLNGLPDFEVYILTAPSIYNPSCYTEKREWVEMHLGFDMVRRLIISPNKGLNKGAYLIDDRITGNGKEEFEGEILHFGSAAYPGWKEIIAYFESH